LAQFHPYPQKETDWRLDSQYYYLDLFVLLAPNFFNAGNIHDAMMRQFSVLALLA
jgi:hypothetical protein